MAIRRQPQTDYGDEMIGGDFDAGGSPLAAGGGEGGGRVDEFGNQIPDFGNDPNFPTPFRDYQPDEIAGNTDSARELAGNTRPNVGGVQSPGSQAMSGLPMGMTVETGDDGGGFGGGYGDDGGGQPSMATPSMSREPSPISGQTPNPLVTRRVSPGGSPSALFGGDSGGGGMFGRFGGLDGGGLGAVGANDGGPSSPTKMMLSLLRMFRNGA